MLFFIIITGVEGYAQGVYTPNGNVTFSTQAQWEDTSNWTCTGTCTNGYPKESTDEILFGESGGYYIHINIGFNLNNVSTELTLVNKNGGGDGGEVNILNGGTATFKNISDGDSQHSGQRTIINVEDGGDLTITEELNWSSSNSELNVNGNFNSKSGIVFNGGQSINVGSSGYLNNTGDMEVSGTSITIAEDGIIEVTGEVTVSTTYGGTSWDPINGAFVIHEGIGINCDLRLDPEVGSNGGVYIDYGGDGTADLCDADMNNLNRTCNSDGFCDALNDDDDKTFTPTAPPDLPVELLFFTGEIQGDDVLLTWATATEENSDFFTIEISNDKINWEEVSKHNAAGNSLVKIDYSTTVNTPAGIYYRLGQYDFDGTKTYYGPIKVDIDNISNWKLYPTFIDSGDDLSLLISSNAQDKVGEYIIYNRQGKVMNSNSIFFREGSSIQPIELSNEYSSGLYIIRMKIGSLYKTFRFIVR
ncbi:T9SS type A sorting domain-containing protein [Flammeovirga pacifica]|uniref:T9SS type A sorting domain-containing protein n=1 Tax=Flammeovirga pacifica TaxID=915059 RepID=UPI001301314D|nr:T9SS type A sorting domain-containing protein [Flammeovirga pacifica]